MVALFQVIIRDLGLFQLVALPLQPVASKVTAVGKRE